jgi:hypothetical protein
MKGRTVLLLVFSLVTVVILGGMSFGQTGVPNQPVPRFGSIHGQIRFPNNQPGPIGLAVYLEEQGGGTSAQTQTDQMGKFEFQQVDAGLYIVRVRAPGFRVDVQEVNLTTFPTAYLNFTLRPEPGSTAAPVPPGGPGASVSALDAAAPDDARKDFEQGRDLLTQGKDIPKSEELLQNAIKAYPQYSTAYLYLGMAYSAESKWPDAEKALEKCVSLNKDNAAAYVALGAAENQQKEYADAEKNLVQAVTLAPESPDAQFELGNTYWGLQRWTDADQRVAKANSLRPDNAGQHILMGNIKLRERDAQGALAEYKEALRISPTGPFAPSAQQMVNKIEAALAAVKK